MHSDISTFDSSTVLKSYLPNDMVVLFSCSMRAKSWYYYTLVNYTT